MLGEIKKELIHNPEKLKEALEYFGYCNITIRAKYIQFGRDENSSHKSIVIKLEHNDYLYVHDYARNIQMDIFSYIMKQRNVEFSKVLNVVKGILKITDYYEYFDNRGVFGGFYDRIRKRRASQIKVLDNSILNGYVGCGNLRFLRDNISLASQRFFDIRYDVESQAIVIPIYDQVGQLIGIKVRCNYDVPDGEMKYYYLYPCAITQTLYGYSHNYEYLVNNIVYLFESEKSVMQCYSYGIRNCVALGSGSISPKQVQMLLELNPRKIVFLHDVGYGYENIMRNINMVKAYSRFSEVGLGYWDYFGKSYENKVSPSDLGKEILENILDKEIRMIGDDVDGAEL